jgi:flagellar hook-basal body complex protein FliE
MAAPILPISPTSIPDIVRQTAPSPSGGSAFQDVFASAVQTVEAAGQNAAGSVQRFLNGEGEELHTTIMATQKAELSFDLFLQARNKVVNAYQEIMRMQM